MSNKREAIIALFESGMRNCDIVRTLKAPKSTVSDAIKRFKELNTSDDRKGRGRKRTVRTAYNRKIIRQRINRNPKISMRRVALETKISNRSVRRIVKEELMLFPYKFRKAQFLTDKNKMVRLQKCKLLLSRHVALNWENILFTDEKIFTIEQQFNLQNNRIWSSSRPDESAIISRRQGAQSVMVWGGICASGKTPLIFVEKGVKLNKENYLRDILQSVVLPWSQQHFENQFWTFQQDSAPSHGAKIVQQWCQANFSDIITAQEWPPYSPDLNPMDYSIWSILETKVCAKPHKSLESLKRSLLSEWDKIPLKVVRAAALGFEARLKQCVKAKGGHFEYI